MNFNFLILLSFEKEICSFIANLLTGGKSVYLFLNPSEYFLPFESFAGVCTSIWFEVEKLTKHVKVLRLSR